MLYLITGASGSGKTACLEAIRKTLTEITWFDFDDFGVPENADKIWRQRTAELWLQEVIALQNNGKDAGINGNITLSEILACPSAEKISAVKACLLDCYDTTRIDRINQRGTPQLATQDTLCWAAWNRMPAMNPQWRKDVITNDSWHEMNWEHWQDWQRGDARWLVSIIDTTNLTINEVAQSIANWVKQ